VPSWWGGLGQVNASQRLGRIVGSAEGIVEPRAPEGVIAAVAVCFSKAGSCFDPPPTLLVPAIQKYGHIVPGVFTPVPAKLTYNLSFGDILAVGMDRMHWNFDPMRKQVITLFFGKIDHDDLRVLTQAVEHDLFPVAGDVEGPHGGTVLKPGEWAGLHGCEIE